MGIPSQWEKLLISVLTLLAVFLLAGAPKSLVEATSPSKPFILPPAACVRSRHNASIVVVGNVNSDERLCFNLIASVMKGRLP